MNDSIDWLVYLTVGMVWGVWLVKIAKYTLMGWISDD